ncbi:MAG: response regulator transcription factor [Phycisphaerales bacterium]|nr:response regulator transcription factor [Phycisphaerales bacterium]
MDKILLIDDDRELCKLLVEYLTQEGFCLDTVHDGENGLTQAMSANYRLVIVDIMLPGISGTEVLRQIREQSIMPVLMLTARGDEVDRIVGLEMGADDYLSKPFNPRELVARIRAILRRTGDDTSNGSMAAKPEVFTISDVKLDIGARGVTVAGNNVEMTSAEFDLLELLMRNAGSVVSRNDLSKAVLGRESSPFDRAIDMHVSNIRKKLGPMPDKAKRIKAVRSVGYLYVISGIVEDMSRRAAAGE